MNKIYSDFGGGLQTNGLHADANSCYELHNFTPVGDRLVMLPGSKGMVVNPAPTQTLDVGATETRINAITTDVESLFSINGKLICKKDGFIWWLWPNGDTPLTFTPIPIWNRHASGGETGKAESFGTLADFIYMSPSQFTKPDYPTHGCVRWSGKAVILACSPRKVSDVPDWQMFNAWNSFNLGATVLIGSGIDDVKPGWIAFLGTAGADGKITWKRQTYIRGIRDPWIGVGSWVGLQQIYTGNTLTPDQRAELSTYNRIALVEVNVVGIPQMTVAPSTEVTTSATATDLKAGTYRYCLQWYSEPLGMGGVPSDPSGNVVVPADNTHRVRFTWSAPENNLYPYTITHARIYRAKLEAGSWTPWELIIHTPVLWPGGTVPNVNLQRLFTWDSTYGILDTGQASLGIMSGDAYRNTRPGVLRLVRRWNNRLYAVEGNNKLRFSSFYRPDSWPEGIADATSTGELVYEGGSVEVGGWDSIQAVVPESGAFGNMGLQGDNLLILKRYKTYRWFGSTWEDFRLTDAFPLGTKDGSSVQNAGGKVIWMGPEHVMSLQVGTDTPVAVSEKLFPMGIAHTSSEWYSTYWREHYVMKGGYVLHTPSMRWFTIEEMKCPAAVDIAQYPDCLVGIGPDTDAGGYMLYDYFYKNPSANGYPEQPQTARFVTRMDPLLSAPEDAARKKWVKKIWICLWNDTGRPQQITLGCNTDLDSKSASITVPPCPVENQWPVIAGPVELNIYGHTIQPLVHLNFIPRDALNPNHHTPYKPVFAVEWIKIEYQVANIVTEAT